MPLRDRKWQRQMTELGDAERTARAMGSVHASRLLDHRRGCTTHASLIGLSEPSCVLCQCPHQLLKCLMSKGHQLVLHIESSRVRGMLVRRMNIPPGMSFRINLHFLKHQDRNIVTLMSHRSIVQRAPVYEALNVWLRCAENLTYVALSGSDSDLARPRP